MYIYLESARPIGRAVLSARESIEVRESTGVVLGDIPPMYSFGVVLGVILRVVLGYTP